MSDGLNVGIRCDARAATGVGHLVRCIALAEELVRRGACVTFLGEVGDDLPWAARQLRDRGLALLPAPETKEELAATARRLGLDAVVTDSYELPPDYTSTCREAGLLVVCIVDGDLGRQDADIFVDQNLDAELTDRALPPGAVRLAGVRYSLFRDSVCGRRPAELRRSRPDQAPRVLCFFGGSDAFEAAPVVARLLIGTDAAFDATVVAARPHLKAALAALDTGPGQTLTVIDPTDDLPDLITRADLVVSASGTSTWELLCLGATAALIWVADNQLLGFDRVVGRGLAAGLGRLSELADGGVVADEAVGTLRRLLTEPALRAELAARGWSEVDARGRERVIDEILRRAAPAGQVARSRAGGSPAPDLP